MVRIYSKIKGFIFDLDGVITDTVDDHYKSWKKVTVEENIPFTREDNEKLRGLTRKKSLEILLNGRKMSEEKKQELADRKNNYYQDFVAEMTHNDLLPGIYELLTKLNQMDYKIAIASSSRNARPIIKNLGIADYFDTISDGNSVKRSKPAPDLFLKTAQRLGLKPEECIVIEDSKSGVKAANTAGMCSVGIGPENRVGGADLIYNSVQDIKLKDII